MKPARNRMNRLRLLVPCVAILWWQGYVAGGRCQAQVTVQLPTFRVTGVSTTVVVPDRGGVYLGGVTSSSLRHNSFGGPFGGHLPGLQNNLGNRSFGRSTTSGGLWIGATITDHSEIDRALLAEADQRRKLRRAGSTQKLTQVKRKRKREKPQHGTTSQPGLAGEAGRAEVYLARAQQAEAKGQTEIARIFYQRIARHGNAAQKKQANERLASLDDARKL